MTHPRRRVLRPNRLAESLDPARQAQVHRRRSQLERERASWARWMSRLKRAFHAVEKQQSRINRLERQLAKLEQE